MNALRLPKHAFHLFFAAVVVAAAACGTGAGGGTPSSPDGSAPLFDGGPGFSQGDDGGGDKPVVPAQLFFVPDTATIVLDGPTRRSTSFVLTAVDADGGTHMVTPESVQFDRPDLATVTANEPVVATAPASATLHGGSGQIHAIYRGKEAVANLTVQVREVDYGPGLDATSPAVVALGGGPDGGASLGPDPATAISPLLYPYDRTVFPLGITSPPVMWNAPQAGDVYRLHYTEKNYTFDGYYTLATLPGSLRLNQSAWDRVTASNDAKAGADPLVFALSRWDHASGVAYATASETWTIAPESLRGAIYYWTTSNGGSLSKIPPGSGATPAPVAGPNGDNCMGCHAVSADGTTLVAGVENEPSTDDANYKNRAWTSFDLPQAKIRKVSGAFSGNLAVTPDGKYVVSGNNTLKLSDSTTGAALPSGLDAVTLDANMTGLKTPAFSPDGATLAAVEAGGDWQYWDYTKSPISELVLLPFDAGTKTFGKTPRKLVDSAGFPSGQQTINYPSFSPDSKWVAYQVGDHASGCWEYVYPDAPNCAATTTQKGAIYIQSTTSGDPIRLTSLSDPPAPTAADANLALEPTFNPIARGGYFWLVFTSERAWGNSPDVKGAADNDKKRLWVSAIDPSVGTADPSHPAFFLEGQDTTTQNMRGFWTVQACVGPAGVGADAGAPPPDASAGDGGVACANGFDCCSGFCVNGQCASLNTISCAGLGASCKTAGDCCNSAEVSCIAGTCGGVIPR